MAPYKFIKNILNEIPIDKYGGNLAMIIPLLMILFLESQNVLIK